MNDCRSCVYSVGDGHMNCFQFGGTSLEGHSYLCRLVHLLRGLSRYVPGSMTAGSWDFLM